MPGTVRLKPRQSDLSVEERERQRAVRKAYEHAHRAEINERMRAYRKAHPETMAAIDRRKRERLKSENPSRAIWSEVRRRARRKGIPFDIEVEDVIVPTTCPILGIPLTFGEGQACDNSPSIDRLDPTRGYVKGNCFVISNKANRMKQDNTLADFRKIVAYIESRLKS